jgi:glucose/mannose-6-phosphate isomerase
MAKETIFVSDIQLDLVDKTGMYKTYDSWPDLASNAFNNSIIGPDFKDIDHIVFAGMGGSGTIGDVFASILSKSEIHVSIIKGYRLPTVTNRNTLVVVTSVSGNTIETLTILEQAFKKNCQIIAFSSGGEIEIFCKKNNIYYYKLELKHSPRASFPIFFYGIAKTLMNTLNLDSKEILDSIEIMKELQKEINSKNLSEKNPALNLALEIRYTPIIYYPWGLKAAAIRFKNSIQENTKTHAFTEDIIEACHNGIVSWETLSNIKPILLQGINDHEKTEERWQLVKSFLKKNKINYEEIVSTNGNIITKLINLIYLLDYISIYKAIISKIDPTPVKSIDYIKNKLKSD